jgi:PKD repeat protein
VLTLLSGNAGYVFAANDNDNEAFTKLRTVDLWTFNEYKYKLTEEFFNLRNDYEVTWVVKTETIVKMYTIAKESYNYLPDNLINKNLYKKLEIALAKTVKYPANESMYLALIEALDKYLDKVSIKSIKGSVTATPKTGNAPLSVSLRGNVKDETGTKIPSYNYIWWVDDAGKRKVIWNQPSIHYVFREEGTFSVFLDVISSHKNSKGFTDVLPFRSRADITVKEKIASVIIKVNSDTLRNKDELKFTPEEGAYGLIFDATSSTPTDGARFTKTEWDFGNGVKKSNNWEPEIERIKYSKEWEYYVSLKLRTNEGKSVERKFYINIHDPIATVNASKDNGFLGEKFTFSAKPTGSDDDLSYDWEIIDIDFDKQIFTKSGKTFTYVFPKKGKYNVKLRVTEPSGEVDIDTQIIYINSRAPVAAFNSKTPDAHKPNTVLLDGSKSYDLDGVDDGKLKFEWIIDGDRVELDSLNYTGGIWYYTFNSIWDHSVLLRVTDPEGISAQITKKVNIRSILSLNFDAYPRVAQRETSIHFEWSSPEAKVFAWDFWDGTSVSGRKSQSSHKYKESGIYKVKLVVTDSNDKTNTYTKNVYIWESNAPLANMKITSGTRKDVAFEKWVCYGEWAYILDRAGSVTFNANDSINVTGKKWGLSYSWKLGYNKYFSTSTFTQKFDELGCSKVQLTVKSEEKGSTSKISHWVKVKNLKPTLSSVDVQVVDGNADPVVVKISALWAKDPDGIIQSYLWYYYTDIDPEPQDFRATKQSNTTFVLPKVTGNYYFVVLMKDNNEARISSEDITGSKYFITLTGDNINVPLVDLSVNDSSISVWEEVTFTVDVENILGHNLSKKAQYSWDLDGDGFYEQKTNTPSILYTYERSGEFYAKVKAKYKGYSNTKNITMNVSNLLKPDVEYISIWNKFVFFDTSIGKSDSSIWDLWDEKSIKNTKSFIHNYEDNKWSHNVSLQLKEWIKTASENFSVSRNMRNILKARKEWIVLFSNKEIKDNMITLDKNKEKVFIYLWESKSGNASEITDFTIDLDINYDSNLNGGKDDDKDISFAVGQNDDIFQVKLNDNQSQNIAITAYDIEGEIMYTQEVLITKNYIENDEIDINSIVFKGVTNAERLIIEKLKSEIKKLPKEYRLKSLMYIQKLQEEWFDAGERTKVIVEFEGYISSVEMPNADTIFDLLKELVLINEDDKSEKNLIFVALKNLTPKNIKCELSSDLKDATCYDAIIERLNVIKVNTDIDQNKVLWKEILQAVEIYEEMKINEKNNYKAILSSLIYGGVENIPEPIKDAEKKILNDTSTGEDGEKSSFLAVLGTIAWIFGIIIGIFLGIFLIFFLWFKIVNKNDNLGFQDFIIEKTSGKKAPVITKKDDTEDILSELDAELSKTDANEKIVESEIASGKQIETNLDNNKLEDKIETNTEEVPDWLKGNFSDDKKSNESNEKKSEKLDTVNNDKKGNSFNKNTEKSGKNEGFNKNNSGNQWERNRSNKFWSNNKNQNKFSKQWEITEKNTDEKVGNTVKKNDDMPDWLKGVEDSTNVEKNTNNNQWNKNTNTFKEKNKSETFTKVAEKKAEINTKEELDTITKVETDSDIPDWLKGSFVEEKTETKKENTSNKLDEKIEVSNEEKKVAEKKDASLQNKVEKNSTQSDDSNIPDWLKGSFDEADKKEEKTDEKVKETAIISNDNSIEKSPESIVPQSEKTDIPDWLKGSFDKTKEKEEVTDVKNITNKKDEIKEIKEIKEVKEEKEVKEVKNISQDSDVSIKNDEEKIVVKKSELKEEKIIKVVDKKTISNNEEKATNKKVVTKNENEVSKKSETVKKKEPVKKQIEQKKETETKEIKKTVLIKESIKDSWKNEAESLVIAAVKKEQKTKKVVTKKDEVKKIEDALWDDGMKIPDWLQTDEDKK